MESSEDELYAEIEEAEEAAAEAEAEVIEEIEPIDVEDELELNLAIVDEEESKDDAPVDMDLDIPFMDIAAIELNPDAAESPLDAAADVDAAAAAPPAEVKRGPGRPCRKPFELNDPVWSDAPPVSSHTLHRLLSDLFTVAADNNLTEKAATDLFQAVQSHLPQGHTMPSYAHAVDGLLRKSPIQLRKYVACPHDCELYSLNPNSEASEQQIPCQVKDLNPDQLKALSIACCVNGHKFCDDKKRVQKVSHRNRERSSKDE